MQILLVEDDVQLARQVSSALSEAGHDPIFVHSGEQALDEAKQRRFDLILLDIILPGMDGLEVLRHLRSQHLAARVLVLSVRGEAKDRVLGLRLGADDYLPKPFVMNELVARVNALCRRYPEELRLRFCVGDLTLDVANYQVRRGPRRPHEYPRPRRNRRYGTAARRTRECSARARRPRTTLRDRRTADCAENPRSSA